MFCLENSVINFFAVQWYGESEFWLALGKALLIIGLIIFTFITMLGANPLGDRYGFRYWRDPGSFAEFYKTGDLGRFLGFLQCMILVRHCMPSESLVPLSNPESS